MIFFALNKCIVLVLRVEYIKLRAAGVVNNIKIGARKPGF